MFNLTPPFPFPGSITIQSDTACIGFPNTTADDSDCRRSRRRRRRRRRPIPRKGDRHLSRGRRRRGRVEITVAAAPQTPAADRCRRYVWAKRAAGRGRRSRAQFFSCSSFRPSVARSAKCSRNRSERESVLVPQSASHWQFARLAAATEAPLRHLRTSCSCRANCRTRLEYSIVVGWSGDGHIWCHRQRSYDIGGKSANLARKLVV